MFWPFKVKAWYYNELFMPKFFSNSLQKYHNDDIDFATSPPSLLLTVRLKMSFNRYYHCNKHFYKFRPGNFSISMSNELLLCVSDIYCCKVLDKIIPSVHRRLIEIQIFVWHFEKKERKDLLAFIRWYCKTQLQPQLLCFVMPTMVTAVVVVIVVRFHLSYDML